MERRQQRESLLVRYGFLIFIAGNLFLHTGQYTQADAAFMLASVSFPEPPLPGSLSPDRAASATLHDTPSLAHASTEAVT
ncbi:MAG TPA: hypothetical protein VGZ22_11375 [Isosphaeraceae bacterium]|jgi:hypothetical protein|nr:hypothetical protein [Isosphaeraceae bacterium]